MKGACSTVELPAVFPRDGPASDDPRALASTTDAAVVDDDDEDVILAATSRLEALMALFDRLRGGGGGGGGRRSREVPGMVLLFPLLPAAWPPRPAVLAVRAPSCTLASRAVVGLHASAHVGDEENMRSACNCPLVAATAAPTLDALPFLPSARRTAGHPPAPETTPRRRWACRRVPATWQLLRRILSTVRA